MDTMIAHAKEESDLTVSSGTAAVVEEAPDLESATAPMTETAIRPRSSLLSLIRDLTQEIRTLIQQEITLAKTELGEKVQYFTKNGVALVIGGVVAYAGLIVLLLGLGFLAGWAIHLAGIQALFATFLGMLFVGLLVAGIGGGLVLKGLSAFRKESLTPQRTMHTLQELRGETAHRPADKANQHTDEPKLSSKEMQAKVEATEGEMGETLEELSHRLDPQYLNDRVKSRIQENPFRAGFIAIGAGLLSGLMIGKRFRT